MERSWLAGARWSECNFGSFCCVIPSLGLLLQRPALLWCPLAARRRSAASSLIHLGTSSDVGPGRRRRLGGRGARGRIFAARARGCARSGASRPSGRSTRRRGPQRPREGLLSCLMAAAPAPPPGLLIFWEPCSPIKEQKHSITQTQQQNTTKTQHNTANLAACETPEGVS